MNIVWKWPLGALVLFAVATAGWGLASGGGAGRGVTTRQYAKGRAQVIQTQLNSMDRGFVILAGDSNAELHRMNGQLCGHEAINAGVSGVTAGAYSDLLSSFLPFRAHAVVLSIGTNNLIRKRRNTAHGFGLEATRLLRQVSMISDAVVVSAIAPVDTALARYIMVEETEAFSRKLEEVCATLPNCRFVDLFAGVRSGHAFGIARVGASVDGLHLRSYEEFYEDRRLCAHIAKVPPRKR